MERVSEIAKGLLGQTSEKNTSLSPEELPVECLYCGGQIPAGRIRYCSERCIILHKRKDNQVDTLFGFGVPLRYIDCSFENYICSKENSAAVNDLKAYDEYTNSIFITGPVGVGKTHLAIAFMRKTMLDATNEQKFYPANDIILKLKNTINSDTSTEQGFYNELKYRKVLYVIDDIGTERPTEYSMQAWYKIIDDRYSSMAPTIYTSNLSIPEFAERYGDRMASRLSSGLIIKLKGTDYRLK